MQNIATTYHDIFQLLDSLGFECHEEVTKRAIAVDPPRTHFVYQHAKTGTVLRFPSREVRPCLQGELLSLRAHLVGSGLVDEESLTQFLTTGEVTVAR